MAEREHGGISRKGTLMLFTLSVMQCQRRIQIKLASYGGVSTGSAIGRASYSNFAIATCSVLVNGIIFLGLY